MRNGYVFLHRRILGSKLWSLQPHQVLVALVCLLMATWRDTEVKGIKVHRGEWLTHYQTIADLCPGDLTERQVRHTIKILCSEEVGFLVSRHVSRHGRHYILVCVRNYDIYQSPWRGRVERFVSRLVKWLSPARHQLVTTLNEEDKEALKNLKKSL